MTEHQLHCAVARYLDLALKPPTIWTSIDAGAGKMSPAAAGRRKARGVKRGWPDIIVLHPGGHYRTLVIGIELKAKKGRVSEEQVDMAERFLGINGKMWICRSLEEVEGVLRIHPGIPLHASVQARAA